MSLCLLKRNPTQQAISMKLPILISLPSLFIQNVLALASSSTYDFIIVGAGTSGLAIANRLSADPSVTVAVIEPGTDERDNPLVTDPTKFGQSFGTDIDWQYRVSGDQGDERQLVMRQGKAWGGTSVLNGMTYVRGEASAINAWETLGNLEIRETGNTNWSWSWSSLLPYFLISENYTIPRADQLAAGATYELQHHGFDGSVNVGYTSGLKNGSFAGPVMNAWKEMGLAHNPDLNRGDLVGFGMGPQTLISEENVRCDASRAYYLPVEARLNLEIISGTVKRIIWSPVQNQQDNFVAEGVEYIAPNSTASNLFARREVILSAGAVRTPPILEASGVGNSQLLTSLGIETVIDIPGVGENLVGQTGHQFTYSGILEPAASAYHTFLSVVDLYGKDGADAIEKSAREKIAAWGDDAAANASGTNYTHLLEIQCDLLFKQRIAAAEVLTIVVEGLLLSQYWILQPFSRGSVHLRSASAADINDPLITPHYLSNPFDLATVIAAGKFVRKFWQSTSIQGYVNATLSPTSDELPANATDAQWEAYLQSTFSPSTRSMGTAAMAPRNLNGVVDPELRVYGTRNVRVIDASVLPLQTSGHVTATLYALAEKAADIIAKAL
ncbi:unnamed protein product [Periconia digitata]|uniref:Glucose-methanol-choline oxidoreductase N-terminal domain-containing protein n=1 Tax=Periconia digitata TaxID=1303443 RepID=A0A9W4U995_9PLEO|nr:unnamed protein product [Periconia digitata]